MDLKSNIHTSFPFYDINYLPKCADSLNGWHFWKQWMPGHLASFQIRREANVGEVITSFKLLTFSGALVSNLTISDIDIMDLPVSEIDYLVFDGITNNTPLSNGDYYIEVGDGVTTWRSVRFRVDSAIDLLKFTYYNSTDIGRILYNKTPQNKNELWLPVDLCNIEDEFEEDGAQRGEMFISRRKELKERYSLEFKAPEYIAKAFSYMWLHDNIVVTRSNGESSQVYDLEVESEKVVTCVVDLNVIFRTGTVLKTGCLANMT